MKFIKFKVWDKDKGEFLKNTREPEDYNLFIEFFKYADDGVYRLNQYKDNLEILLCAEIEDINDNMIYEGDILETEHNNRYLVEFHSGGFTAENGFHYVRLRSFCEANEVEIVGNVFENPELLEEVE